jgi:hypothetical protein
VLICEIEFRPVKGKDRLAEARAEEDMGEARAEEDMGEAEKRELLETSIGVSLLVAWNLSLVIFKNFLKFSSVSKYYLARRACDGAHSHQIKFWHLSRSHKIHRF